MDGLQLEWVWVESSHQKLSQQNHGKDGYPSHEVWVHCGTMRAKSQSWAELATAVDIDMDSCLEDETV